jgi:hypothetical protein
MATLAPNPRLRGREVELRELGDAFGRLASGHPWIVLVEGEAGIGKTRLLADAVADARSRGLQVVTGQAQELERARPFGVLADAFGCAASSPDPRRRAIASLLAPGAPWAAAWPGCRWRWSPACGRPPMPPSWSGPCRPWTPPGPAGWSWAASTPSWWPRSWRRGRSGSRAAAQRWPR